MSEVTRIVRIPRTDEKADRLLLHITQTSQQPLHLKLIATEHEHLYHAELKQSNLSTIRSSQFKGEDEELQGILLQTMLHVKTEEKHNQDLELAASIHGDLAKVNVRRNIGGIIQLVATLNLEQDDEREEVSPFSWVDEAVGEIEDERKTTSDLEQSLATARAENDRLKAQLQDLVQARKEHDEELLQKFGALLTTKKHRIRELTGISPGVSGLSTNTNGNQRRKRTATDVDDEDMDEEQAFEDVEAAEDDEYDEDQNGRQTDDSEAEEQPSKDGMPIRRKNGASQSSATVQAESMEHDDETEDEL